MKIHNVEKYVPSTFKVAYPRYAQLMSEYSKFLNAHDSSDTLNEYIDYVKGDFDTSNFFYKQNELFFNTQQTGDHISKVVRYVNDSAGSIDAIKCFFMLAHADKVEILVPKNVLIKSSNTIHSQTRVYNVVHPDTVIDKITRLSDTTTPFIEKQYSVSTGSTTTHVLMVDSSFNTADNDVVVVNSKDNAFAMNPYTPDFKDCTNFMIGDYITVSDRYIIGEYKVTSVLIGSVYTVDIRSGGTDYIVGDVVRSTTGNGFYAVVSGVDSVGSITSINVKNSGRFIVRPTLYTISQNGHSAVLDIGQNDIGKIGTFEVIQSNVDNVVTSVSASNANAFVSINQLHRTPVTKSVNLLTNSVLGINNFVIDSNNLHENSFTIITKTPELLWCDVVNTHLNRYGNTYRVVYNLIEVADTYSYPQTTAEVYI